MRNACCRLNTIPSKLLLAGLTLGLMTPLFGQGKQAVAEVLQEAYLDGVYNERVERNVRLGFSESFTAFYWDKNSQSLHQENLKTWIAAVQRNPGFYGNTPADGQSYRMKIIQNDAGSDMAQVQLLLYRGKEMLGTRYITLFRFPEGWKITVLVAR